jgi:hypothetical protein
MGYHRLPDRSIEAKMKLKLIKINTVLVRRPRFTGKCGKEKRVPLISISGLSLNAYGFEVGRKFEVYAQRERLVLKTKEFKYKNPKIKQEVNKKAKWSRMHQSREPQADLDASGG